MPLQLSIPVARSFAAHILTQPRSALMLAALASMAAILSACTPFTAELSSSATDGSAPLEVTFTNDGSEAESHEWNFGDGSEAQETGPTGSVTHTFTKAGTFTVTLNATSGEDTDSATATITVSPGQLTTIVLETWPEDVVAGTSAIARAYATDDYGNRLDEASLTFEVPGAAGTIDGSGNFAAATAIGDFADGLTVTAALDGVTVTQSADLNVIPASLDRVEVDPAELELTPTDAVQITVRALDRFGNEIEDVEVEFSAASSVGSVTAQGRFTAARAVADSSSGITVAVSDGGSSQEVTLPVTVIPGPLASVEISPTVIETEVATSVDLSAVALDSFGNEIPGVEISWSTNSAAGRIGSTGSLTAGFDAGAYEAAVTASANQDEASVESSIDVTLLPAAFSQVVATTAEVTAGGTGQLSAVAADRYGNEIEGATLAWSVLDSSVGSVSEAGLLTAGTRAKTYAGSVQVEATLDDQTESTLVDVTITPAALTQVVMLPGNVKLGMSIEQQYVAAAGDRYGNRISGATLAWQANESAGTIDGNGLFLSSTTPGNYADAVTVTASFGGNEVSASETVEVQPDRILYYTADSPTAAGSFALIGVDGSGSTALPYGDGSYGRPEYSPDGRRIAYDLYTIDGGIVLTDELGTWQRLIVTNSFQYVYVMPSWSPDGRKLAMIRADADGPDDIFVYDIDGGGMTQITNTPDIDEAYPTWSPDGKFLVFDATQPGANADIWKIDASTLQKTRLTTHTSSDKDPHYSPDGTKIVFASFRSGNYDIWVMNSDGTNQVNLTNSSGSDAFNRWNSDGTKIVFESDRDGDYELFTVNPDGTGITQLTHNTTFDVVPIWAPRKQAVTVNVNALVLAAEPGPALTTQQLTAKLRSSVVRITTNLGSGSGFVIGANGLILTNNHVIVDATQINVFLDDGTQYTATVVGRDMTHDMAVLKIDATELTPLEFASITQADLGSDVLVLGYPLGSSDLNVTRGVVSSVKADSGANVDWVQTDAAVNPGNSGGPMVNTQGQVVGIVSAALFGTTVENVAYAEGSVTILTYLDRLLAGETVIIN